MNYKDFGIYIVAIVLSISINYIIQSIEHGPEVIDSWQLGVFSGLGGILIAFVFLKERKEGEREENEKDEKG